MVTRLLGTIREASKALRNLIKMAENTSLVMGEKRASEEPGLNEKAKKKKKEHIFTLGKSEGFKRKVALLVAYNGGGYYGVQINRGFKTIESDLFEAMVKAGAVPQEHVDDTSKMWFQRGSRTDKGVSAVGQTFSLKMMIVPDVVSKLNENLPEQIRVLGYIRTTNGFDSKNFCCGRTYMYMTPTFAFAPLEKFITDDYRITDDRIEHVRSILKQYMGTHKFHNFTSGVKYQQACASRYIINFECSDPYVRDGMEFVTLRVRGQSFMLHQIRKMIGLTIAILRGYCGESSLTKSWQEERVDIPKAPGLGLVLEALHFDGYNKKFGCDGVHEPIDWSHIKDKMEDFKEKYIISDIVQQEKKDRVMLNWLQTLQFHNFDETRSEGPQKPWVKTEKMLKEKIIPTSNPESNKDETVEVRDDISSSNISAQIEPDPVKLPHEKDITLSESEMKDNKQSSNSELNKVNKNELEEVSTEKSFDHSLEEPTLREKSLDDNSYDAKVEKD